MAPQQQTLNVRFTPAHRTVIAELLPDLADRLLLDLPNQCTLTLAADELKSVPASLACCTSH